jgi:uncharacterized protein (DUF342 family)
MPMTALAPQRLLGPELRAALARPSLGEALAAQLRTWLVTPGEELARGEELEAGEGVEVAGGRCLSRLLGYACREEGRLGVLPPLWLSPDRMEVHLILFPQAQPLCPLQPEWLEELLWLAGVRRGIRQEAIEALCQSPLPAGLRRAVLLAQGTAPVHGADARFRCTFDLGQQSSRIAEDGTVDFSGRNGARLVWPGQVLARVVPATPGRPGVDVAGAEVPARPGRELDELPLVAGENVRVLCHRDRAAALVSKARGHLRLEGDEVAVRLVRQLPEAEGNLEVDRDLRIAGNVRAGASVKAGGSILIGGCVEPGAALRAQGDILIAKGVSGESTRLWCQGSLETKFIQDCEAQVHGNVLVGSYILHARVRAGGGLRVWAGGGPRGGSIAGGEVCATLGVEARFLGSPGGEPTLVGVGPDPRLLERLDKLGEVVDFCDAGILRLLRTLGLKALEVGRIKEIVAQATPARRAYLLDLVRKLTELAQTREQALKTREHLQEQLAGPAEGGRIQVSGTAFAGAQVHINGLQHHVASPLERPVFSKGRDGILVAAMPAEQPASGG